MNQKRTAQAFVPLRRVTPVAAALAAVASCQVETRSITGVPRTGRPVAVVASPTTAAISPTADTYLNLDATSHATEDSLNLYTWPNDSIANAIVMKFDLSSIPAGSTISSATLNLYLRATDAFSDPTYTVTVHKIVNKNPVVNSATGYTYDGVNAWTPSSCCHGGVPLAQADISAAVDTRSVDKTLGLKQWGVTSIVQQWFSNPSTNFGLLLNSDPSKLADRYRQFWSSEAAATNQRPYLTVVYTPPLTILFQSNWTTDTGAPARVILDSNSATPWDMCGPSSCADMGGANLIAVDRNNHPQGYPASLRLQQRGPVGAADVRKNAIPTANTDYYLRYYFMTNDTNGVSQDHGVEPWTGRTDPGPQYYDLTYLNKNERPSGWGVRLTIGDFEVSDSACRGHHGVGCYPFVNWNLVGTDTAGSLPVLSYNTWYRFEYWVHFDSANHIQVRPRIYNAAGSLLYDEHNFVQDDAGPSNGCDGGGVGNWTLALWYTQIVAGCNPRGDFYVDPRPAPPGFGQDSTSTNLQGLLMGNNASSSTQPGFTPGRFYYYAGVQMRDDTWPGR